MTAFMDGSQLCAQTDPEIFFAQEIPGAFRTSYRYEKEAKEMCGRCTQQPGCLEYAISQPDLDGIWGGTLPKERMRLRARRRLA